MKAGGYVLGPFTLGDKLLRLDDMLPGHRDITESLEIYHCDYQETGVAGMFGIGTVRFPIFVNK
jgi:hypothetical protein